MAKFVLHQQAIELRKHGKSYSQIKKELGLSKSTLSLWLRSMPLSKEQINQLRGKSEVRIEKFRQTWLAKRQTKLTQYYKEEKKTILPFSKRELFIAGLFLYWGEGGKTTRDTISINNTDPAVLKFALIWLKQALNVPEDVIKVYIHLYNDMDREIELEYWSQELKIPRSQFLKPYIKQNKRSDLTQKGFGHGTCGLRVHSTILKERLLMGLKVVKDYTDEIIGLG